MGVAVRPRRAAAVLASAAALAAGLLATAPAPASAATSSTRLAPGVTLGHVTAGGQSVWVVTTAMSSHARLTVGTPREQIGAPAMTTLALARQEHAIAGLNGDTFYFDNSPKGRAFTPTLGPHGGVVRNGTTLKAPLEDQNAVFIVTGAGHAYIGQVHFTGTLRAATGGPKKIASVNSVETAWNGGIALIDHAQATHTMSGHNCSEAVLKATSSPGRYTVASVATHISVVRQLSAGWHAILTCSGGVRDNLAYVRDNLHRGATVSATIGYGSRGIRTLISGTTKLIGGGRAFHDDKAHRAVNVYGNQRRAETFVCVQKNRTTVSFGAFQGNSGSYAGVTYAQETAWLLKYQHCYEAMAVDGSTSSTVVAQKPHSSLAVQYHATASGYPGGQRPQVDGLFVVTH